MLSVEVTCALRMDRHPAWVSTFQACGSEALKRASRIFSLDLGLLLRDAICDARMPVLLADYMGP